MNDKEVITEDEKTILRNLDKRFKWIARDEDGMLCIYKDKPHRNSDTFYSCDFEFLNIYKHLFQFISWEDEPCLIEDLLKEE